MSSSAPFFAALRGTLIVHGGFCMARRWRVRWWVFLLLFLGFPAHAAPVAAREVEDVHVSADFRQSDLAANVGFFFDPTGEKTLPEVMAAGVFRRDGRKWPSFGFTRDAVWARVRLRSVSDRPADLVLLLHNTRAEELTWHILPAGRDPMRVEAGTRNPDPAALRSRLPTVRIRLDPGDACDVYVRVRSQAAVQMPMRLWSLSEYAEHQARTGFTYAFFFGYIVALVVLAVFFSLFTRDLGYLIYAATTFLLLLHLVLLSGHYAWLGGPAAPFMTYWGVPINLQAILFMMFVYVRRLFDVPRILPWADRWLLRPCMALALGMLVLLPVIGVRATIQISLLQSLAYGAIIMGLALVLHFRGMRTARLYFLAWVTFWCAVAFSTLQYKGLLSFFVAPEALMLWGTALGMTLFLVVMAYKVRLFREEQLSATAKALTLEQQLSHQLEQEGRRQQDRLRRQTLLLRDLHDGLGGMIATVGMVAEIGRRQTDSEADRSRYSKVVDLSVECGSEIRSLIGSIEASTSTWPDFIDLTRQQGERLFGPLDIRFEHTVEGDVLAVPPVDALSIRSLARVAKEALINAAKHSGARQVHMTLRFGPQALDMEIRDDGRGMSAAESTGRGLTNMRRRVEELGGGFLLDSDAGIRIRIHLPLPLLSPDLGMLGDDHPLTP